MDFIKLINGSRLYNFHSHTEFCDGHATMEAFAREVVARGFDHYGFSPHSPVPIESPCNMLLANVPRYLAEVERIRREHGASTRYYASMEVDYLGELSAPCDAVYQQLPLDYLIGSVHFIPSQQGRWVDIDGNFQGFRRKMAEHFHNDIRYVVERFYSQSRDMIDAGGFDIVGHFDKIGQNASYFCPGIEEEDWYQELVNGLIDRIIAHNACDAERPYTVEINTKAYAEHGGRLFPHPRHWQRLHEAGIPLIVNSDAHVPALVNASRDVALEMLRNVEKKCYICS